MCDYHEFENKEVQCRKDHECGWCAERVNKGERAQFRKYIWWENDGITSDWMHLECCQAMRDMLTETAFACEGWMPGDFPRGSNEPR